MMSFEALYRSFVDHKENLWIMRPENAHALYQFMQKKDGVKRVLDLGTGIGSSSAVIALALASKGSEDFQIHTVEQTDKCVNIAKEIIPKELQEHITFHRTDVVPWTHEKIPFTWFSIFKELPDGDFDAIIVDGPAPWLSEKDEFIDLPNGDVMKMMFEDKIKPKTVLLFDGRVKALSLLERYFFKNFYLVGSLTDRLNVIERKDNIAEYGDMQKAMMKNLNYFKP